MQQSEYDKFIQDAMQKQPVINIGMIGHVANGKSTLTGAVTGIKTQKHTSEKERGITIRLGYANAKIFKCPSCKAPECYQSTGSATTSYKCTICGNFCDLVSHVSFTDVPGHHLLMSTMLNGTCVMDYTILVESSANEVIPAPQTIEHYQITKKVGIDTQLICLNKVDLLVKNKHKYPEILSNLRNFIKEHQDVNIPIIPVSGSLNCNVDVLCEYIAKMKIPKKNLTPDFKMLVIRSFNVNNPNINIKDLKGGVVGGSLVRGIINVGQDVVVYPGHITKKSENDKNVSGIIWTYRPLTSKVISINTDKSKLTSAIPGGLIGVQLTIDPALTGSDVLVGQVVFRQEKDLESIKIYEGIKIEYSKIKDESIKKDTIVQVNVNSNNINGKVIRSTKHHLYLELDKPVCVELNDIVTINKLLDGGGINIYGHGIIVDGISSEKLM